MMVVEAALLFDPSKPSSARYTSPGPCSTYPILPERIAVDHLAAELVADLLAGASVGWTVVERTVGAG